MNRLVKYSSKQLFLFLWVPSIIVFLVYANFKPIGFNPLSKRINLTVGLAFMIPILFICNLIWQKAIIHHINLSFFKYVFNFFFFVPITYVGLVLLLVLIQVDLTESFPTLKPQLYYFGLFINLLTGFSPLICSIFVAKVTLRALDKKQHFLNLLTWTFLYLFSPFGGFVIIQRKVNIIKRTNEMST